MSTEPIERTISRPVRNNILDILRVESTRWWGRLDDVAFLGRIWDLESMPSTDSRFGNAAQDIWQHREHNDDWPNDWLFKDGRFDLLGCPDEVFLRFLAEMVHPVVREDENEAEELVSWFNECLTLDRWKLVPVQTLRGRPVLEGRRVGTHIHPATALELDRYTRLDDPYVLGEHLRRIEQTIEADPSAAIGAAKELVESACRLVLRDYDAAVADRTMDLPELYREVADKLALKAESVPDHAKGSKAAQQTLRTLVTTIQSLAELRNQLGSGHGRGHRSPARPRHARLAFHAAVTVTDFLLATWHERRGSG